MLDQIKFYFGVHFCVGCCALVFEEVVLEVLDGLVFVLPAGHAGRGLVVVVVDVVEGQRNELEVAERLLHKVQHLPSTHKPTPKELLPCSSCCWQCPLP